MLLDKIALVKTLQVNNPLSDQEVFVTHSGYLFNGTVAAAVKINIQPASPELTAISDGEVFKTYRAFTQASGVVEGMTLTISGTNELYRVRGREAFNYGMGRHYELTLIKSDPNVP